MTKGERISRFVQEMAGHATVASQQNVTQHPCYRAFFQCWNEQRYYEAHDVLEHLWLDTTSDDWRYFKGLIQAAGAFVHLQRNFEHPMHPKHSRRLAPAVRLFRLAEKNLTAFGPARHGFDVAAFVALLQQHAEAIVASEYTRNPWSPEVAPRLSLPKGGL